MQQTRRHSALLLVLGAAVAGCGPIIDSASFGPPAPPTRAEDLRVYSTRMPACEYEELGVVRGSTRDRFSSLQDVLDGMRQRAASMGGDALIQFSAGTQVSASGTPAAPPVASSVSMSADPVLVATVVRFTEPCPAEPTTRAPR